MRFMLFESETFHAAKLRPFRCAIMWQTMYDFMFLVFSVSLQPVVFFIRYCFEPFVGRAIGRYSYGNMLKP